jgi:malonyl-CoA O-methyltransferase
MDSFNKFAHTYSKYNIVQRKIIKKYLPYVKSKVVDLGCGNGIICEYKNFDFYLGIDISENMLKLHPCKTIKLDFNTKKCFEKIKKYDFEQIISFSALQWARDLDFIFKEIKSLYKDYLFAIFTSNTFKSIHNYLVVKSPIYSKEEILKSAQILNPEIEVLNYQLEFNNPLELLKYIKFSGVSGNVNVNIGKLKNFVKYFPIDILEFEILILKSNY